jgi:hypothetical protein
MDRPEVRVPVAGSPLSSDGRLCMITIGIDPHKSSLTAVAIEMSRSCWPSVVSKLIT